MLGSAEEETKKAQEIYESTGVMALREQQEVDFGLWGPYEFRMPTDSGKWENVTTNSPKRLANLIMGILASSWLQLFIDEGEPDKKKEKKKERKLIANSERLANGCIWVADREAINVPSKKTIQSTLVSQAVLRGGTVKGVYWYTEDGEDRCSVFTYDPFGCLGLEGKNGLAWFCYREMVTKDYIDSEFKDAIEKEGFQYGESTLPSKKYLMYTIWDSDEWKVAIGKQWVDEHKHGLGYIPINVRTCGFVPYMASERFETDSMKHSWMSCYFNTREVYDIESMLLSIELSKALLSGKITVAGQWNSQLSDNKPPEGLKKLGYGEGNRNNVLLFDEALGQKFGGMIEPPGNEIVDRLLTRVKADMDVGVSIDPVASGQMTRSGSGALAAELRAAALEFINPFRECVEEDFKWIGKEIVSQFIDGQYSKAEVEGYDRKREKFSIELTPKDIVDKRFDCHLVPDKLRDKIQELGAAIQQVSYGLTSKRTARIQHNIVDDPDREQDIMDEERAKDEPLFYYDNMAKYYMDQDNERMALAYEAMSRLIVQRMMEQATVESLLPQGREGGNRNKPPMVSPQMNNMNVATQPNRGV